MARGGVTSRSAEMFARVRYITTTPHYRTLSLDTESARSGYFSFPRRYLHNTYVVNLITKMFFSVYQDKMDKQIWNE